MIVKGHEAWDELVGEDVSFDWSDGWDDYSPRYVVGGTQVYAEDPRYPRYYVLDEQGGGVSFWEDEEVVVTVHER